MPRTDKAPGLTARETQVLQMQTMRIAANVRNRLEEFHGAGEDDPFIDDERMAKLNRAIREAIFQALYVSYAMAKGVPGAQDAWAILGRYVPDYWEVPGGKDLGDFRDLSRYAGVMDLRRNVSSS